MEKKLSDFTDMCRGQSKKGISENGEAVLDVAELADENSGAVVELAEMIGDIEERIGALEEGA